jgi:hypothetical protein
MSRQLVTEMTRDVMDVILRATLPTRKVIEEWRMSTGGHDEGVSQRRIEGRPES